MSNKYERGQAVEVLRGPCDLMAAAADGVKFIRKLRLLGDDDASSLS